MEEKFKAIVINQTGEQFSRKIENLDKSFFKSGDVMVKVEYSGLNYKDALILKNGAKLVKEVASKTSDVAGDGTTTATVLAEAIFNNGLKCVSAGIDPVALNRGMKIAVDKVVEKLLSMSKAIKDAAKYVYSTLGAGHE